MPTRANRSAGTYVSTGSLQVSWDRPMCQFGTDVQLGVDVQLGADKSDGPGVIGR